MYISVSKATSNDCALAFEMSIVFLFHTCTRPAQNLVFYGMFVFEACCWTQNTAHDVNIYGIEVSTVQNFIGSVKTIYHENSKKFQENVDMAHHASSQRKERSNRYND